jgi:hypothetical protein
MQPSCVSWPGLPLRFWSAGAKAHWMRITPTEVTGRRLPPSPASEVGRAVTQVCVRRYGLIEAVVLTQEPAERAPRREV